MLLSCINEQGPVRYIKPSGEWNERRQSVAFHNDLQIPWYVEGERTTHFLSAAHPLLLISKCTGSPNAELIKLS